MYFFRELKALTHVLHHGLPGAGAGAGAMLSRALSPLALLTASVCSQQRPLIDQRKFNFTPTCSNFLLKI